MLQKLHDYLTDLHDFQRVTIAITKGMAARSLRSLDMTRPGSWEFSGFSQNGEDGILEVLRSQLKRPSNDFLEIGSADGVQNNTSWMLMTEQCHGLMVEGNPALSAKAKRLLATSCIGGEFLNAFATKDNAADLIDRCVSRTPDVFSIDIDGNDYYVARALLEGGLRPKVIVAEYNSAFGPHRSLTIPYDASFDFRKAHPKHLYYGASLAAWRKLFGSSGYHFLTVERHGVNAVFADPDCFAEGFLGACVPLPWAENVYQARIAGGTAQEQYELVKDLPLVEV